MATETLEKFVTALGFDYDPKGLTDFQNGVDDVTGLLKKLATAAVGAAAAIFGLVAASTAATDEQGKMADQIGITVDDLAAWQGAASLAGDTAEGLSSSLAGLARAAGEAARGTGAGVEAFGILGISITDSNGKVKTATQLYMEASRELQKFGKAEQMSIADKLGLTSSIRLLQQGPRAIAALVKDIKGLGVATKEDAMLSADFQDSMVRLWVIIKDISRTITRELAPGLNKAMTYMTEWWRANREIIQQRLPEWLERASNWAKLLGIAFTALVAIKIVAMLIALGTALKGIAISMTALTVSAKGFTAVMAGLKGVLILLGGWPVVIATAILSLGILAEDSMGFFEGQESLMGDMIARYPQWEGALTNIAVVLATIGGTAKEMFLKFFKGWGAIISFMLGTPIDDIVAIFWQIIEDVKSLFNSFVEWIGLLFNKVIDKVITDFKKFDTFLTNLIKDAIDLGGDFAKKFVEGLAGIATGIGVAIRNGIAKAKDALKRGFGTVLGVLGIGLETPGSDPGGPVAGAANVANQFLSSTPAPANISNSTSSQTSSRQVTIESVTVEVNGSTDPQATGEAVVSEMLRQASEDVSTTVKR